MTQVLKKYGDTIQKHIDGLIARSKPDSPAWNVEHITGTMNEKGVSMGAKPVKWNYIDGCMITALLSLYKITKQSRVLEFCDNFVSFYVDDDGSIRGYQTSNYNIDDINGGRNFLTLLELTGKHKYKLAADTLYGQLQNHPRINSGNFWHKKIYPNQVWLDGLYMGQVFYSWYQKQFMDCKKFDDIFGQFEFVHNIMFDKNKKLYYHGYDDSRQIFWCDKQTGLSPSFWLRSNGWLLCALVDTLEVVGLDDVRTHAMVAQLNQLLDGLMQYQSDGMFFQVIDKVGEQGNYLETSGSAMVAYACLKANRLGIRQQGVTEGDKIFESICQKYLKTENGELSLGGINLVSGLGPYDNPKRDGSYKYYISEPVVKDDAKGIMPFVSAYVELLHKEKQQ